MFTRHICRTFRGTKMQKRRKRSFEGQTCKSHCLFELGKDCLRSSGHVCSWKIQERIKWMGIFWRSWSKRTFAWNCGIDFSISNFRYKARILSWVFLRFFDSSLICSFNGITWLSLINSQAGHDRPGVYSRPSTDRVSRFLPCGEKHERLRILSNHYMNIGYQNQIGRKDLNIKSSRSLGPR